MAQREKYKEVPPLVKDIMAYMKARELKQCEMADYLGIGHSTLSAWKNRYPMNRRLRQQARDFLDAFPLHVPLPELKVVVAWRKAVQLSLPFEDTEEGAAVQEEPEDGSVHVTADNAQDGLERAIDRLSVADAYCELIRAREAAAEAVAYAERLRVEFVEKYANG